MPLPILDLARAALAEVKRHFAHLMQAAVLPAAVLAIAGVVVEREPTGPHLALALFLPLTFVAYALMAVSCHRIVLLGDGSIPNRWSIYWTAATTRYLGWSIVGGLIVMMMVIPTILILVYQTPDGFSDWMLRERFWVRMISYIPIGYVMARISLVLPGAAIDHRPSLADAWNLSRKNGWRLTILLSIPFVAVTGTGALTHFLLGNPDGPIAAFADALVFALLGVVEVVFLSIAYRHLSSRRSEPTGI